MIKTEKITFRLSAEEKKLIEDYCESVHLPVGYVIREQLLAYIQKNKEKNVITWEEF